MYSELLRVDPDLSRLGVSTAVVVARGVDNATTSRELIAYRRQVAKELAAIWRGESITDDPRIRAYRSLHRRFGATSEPASPEKLLSFVRRNHDLTGTGAVIDCYNLASIRTLVSVGAHDLANLEPPVTLRVCAEEDRFRPLDGAPPRSCAGEYGYVDAKNRIVCRLDVLQGAETAVHHESKDVAFFLQGNAALADTDLLRGAWYLVELLECFCGGDASLVGFDSARSNSATTSQSEGSQ